jgi:DNA-binding response OmpR family regulator
MGSQRSRHNVLIVEDNKADVFLIREALQLAQVDVNLHVVEDGEKAVQFFTDTDNSEAAPCPALVILDINLPKKHGGQVLREMRKTRKCANARVLVVTSSDSAKDRGEMAKLSVNGYFRKPSEYEEFMKLGELVKSLLDELSAGPVTE